MCRLPKFQTFASQNLLPEATSKDIPFFYREILISAWKSLYTLINKLKVGVSITCLCWRSLTPPAFLTLLNSSVINLKHLIK
jgi:hypothetical protein